ncbi:MAG: ABC transporter ATP-binding protein [Actinobacteria bacterium]|nr:ABC transporter ATP-binding protein [Actinomycetota bacterium]
MEMLDVRGVVSGYGELQILWGLDLVVEEGKLTALVGSNGAGKTTLLRTIMGQITPWEGTVTFQGEDVSRMPAHAKAELGMIMVPEGRQLFSDMTVRENLEMGATPKRARARMDSNLTKVFTLFPRLEERSKQSAGTMSGGEQQMLAVARGIMAEPKILMIDELSLGLAPVLTLELFHSLQQLQREGLTILLVEQNVRMALKVSEYAFVMSEGKVDFHGTSAEIEQNDAVKQAYLGI